MQDKKVLVFGMARSGLAAAKLLLWRGARVWVCDAKAEADFNGALDDLKAAGAQLDAHGIRQLFYLIRQAFRLISGLAHRVCCFCYLTLGACHCTFEL